MKTMTAELRKRVGLGIISSQVSRDLTPPFLGNKERKNARYAGWACHDDDSFGSFASFVKKVLFTSRPLQIQIEKNPIELFWQQIVKWSPQALKNWYKLYLQILHVNEVFTNGNFFVPHLRDIHLITRSCLRSQFYKFSNENHSQLTILKYQQLLTNVFQRSFHKAQILHLEKNKEKNSFKVWLCNFHHDTNFITSWGKLNTTILNTNSWKLLLGS